jgi:hypothetical protein
LLTTLEIDKEDAADTSITEWRPVELQRWGMSNRNELGIYWTRSTAQSRIHAAALDKGDQ